VVLERLSMAGKRVIVTGAGRGLGRQIAFALADAGADIACAARTVDEIEATAEAVRARGRRALAIPTDVTQAAQVNTLVERTVADLGGVDVFVANAGGGAEAALRDVAEIDDDEWRRALDLNLSSVMFGARAVAPAFRERGGGVIVTVGSVAGLRADPRLLAYGAAKAAVINLTASLAQQLARDNVRVNTIVPGFVLQHPLDGADAIAAARARGAFLPAGRIGEVWEIGPLALFLASDASSYVTGAAFVMDGGGLAGGAAPIDWDATAQPGTTAPPGTTAVRP
jgi:NAD(P)-dependent dehydrogenase (short-subunit alcohol dehydrogenase family)